MMFWRTDVLKLQGDIEVCRQFPDAADDTNQRRNWRVYLKARVVKPNLCALATTQSFFMIS